MSVFSQNVSVVEIEEKLISICGEINGVDSNDKIYNGIQSLWKNELKSKDKKGKSKWYSNAFNYWESEENCSLDEDGVLGNFYMLYFFSKTNVITFFKIIGGYGKVTPSDIKDSNIFLNELSRIRPELKFDNAAGIKNKRSPNL